MSSRRNRQPARVWGFFPLLAILLSAGLVVTLGIGAVIVGYLALGLPDIQGLKKYRPPLVTEVLDREFRPLAYWYEERRWYVPSERLPKNLVNAFLAAEDARFYDHPGIDFYGVVRAIIKNVEAGEIVQGASTITQQVTRAMLLTPEKSWVRKIKEAVLAWQIDRTLSKDEILAIYLNQIYLGHGAYGVEAAARTYFNKHVEDLALGECALIAGLPQAPSRYDPYKNMESAHRRQAYVLRRMAEEGFVSEAEAVQAVNAPVILASDVLLPPPGVEYFLAEVRKDLEARYGRKRLLTSGLTVVTTLDSSWQFRAHEALVQGVNALLKRHPKDKELAESVRCALVAMDLDTGAVRAMVGGIDFGLNQFNYATQGRMQPGSAFKPIVYASAMAKGLITPTTLLMDEPIALAGSGRGDYWTPGNYDGEFLGPVTVRTAITLSRNVISVKVAQMTGVGPIKDLARKMGIVTPLTNDLTLSLGSSAVPLIQMVQAYGTFPNLGVNVEPRLIRYVRDQEGRMLEGMDSSRREVLDPVTAYQMVHLLEGVIQEGTGTAARALGVPAGGKTGTSNDFRDAWFVGFTPEVVAGVWVGREDRKTIGNKETGGKVACPIWTDFMSVTKAGMEKAAFDIPSGIALVKVEKETGALLDQQEGDDRERGVWEAVREEDIKPVEEHSDQEGPADQSSPSRDGGDHGTPREDPAATADPPPWFMRLNGLIPRGR